MDSDELIVSRIAKKHLKKSTERQASSKDEIYGKDQLDITYQYIA
jgi:hypothetical protein